MINQNTASRMLRRAANCRDFARMKYEEAQRRLAEAEKQYAELENLVGKEPTDQEED